MEKMGDKMAQLQVRADSVTPNLKAFRKALKVLIGYQTDYGIAEDLDFVCPQTVSEPSVDNSRLAAHNEALKVTKTFEQIALLLNRAAAQEIPAAQRARYRHFVLKRRNRTCNGATAAKKQAAKKHKLQQRAKDEALMRNEMPKLEELGGGGLLDEPDLS